MTEEDRYDSLIVYWASQFKRDPKQVKRQIRRESSFHPGAHSAANALGLMQFMPATWVDVMGSNSVMSRTDPELSIKAGCKYMAFLEREFGALDKALAAYNWGPGNVHSLNDITDWLNHCPLETKVYVAACMDYSGETLCVSIL